MATLKQGIATYLTSLPEVSSIVWSRVYSRRVTKGKTDAPYIVYSVDGYENKLGKYQGWHGYKGLKLVIDVVGPYDQEDALENLSNILTEKLGGFIGNLWGRVGTLSVQFVDAWYDEKSDFSVFRTGLLAKETF